MKTTRTPLRAGAGLLVSALLSSGVLAGPGPEYWNIVGKGTSSSASTKPVAATSLCAGAETVIVTTMKPSWPNGRGPLTEMPAGTRIVCHLCRVTSVVTTNAWPSGRGPMVRTEVVKPGATHDCSAGCNPVAMK